MQKGHLSFVHSNNFGKWLCNCFKMFYIRKLKISCLRTYAYFVEAITVRSIVPANPGPIYFLIYIYNFSPSHILRYNYNTAYMCMTMIILHRVHVLRTIYSFTIQSYHHFRVQTYKIWVIDTSGLASYFTQQDNEYTLILVKWSSLILFW